MKKGTQILILTFVLFSFGFRAGGDSDEFKIVKEDGTLVALNPDHPVPVKNSPRDIIFTEELIIGEIAGDPHYIFSEFIRYTVDDSGNIYVLDWRGKTVRKFDSNGRYQLSIGREGQGPGEFSFPEEIRFLPNEHLLIFEGETQKFSYFDLEGKFLVSERFFKLMTSPYFGFTNGNFIATNTQRDSKKTVIIIGLFNEKSELLVSLYQKEAEPYRPWPSQDNVEARARRLAEVWSKIAFRPETVIALNEKEEIYFAFADKYEIKIYSAEAKLKKIIKTGLPLLSVKKKDRQGYLNYWLPRDISGWNSMSKQMQNKIKSLIRFPDKKPAFLSIIPMDNDYLMVVRDGSFKQNSLIDIFDSSGRFIIEKELNFHIKNGLCKGGKLYSIYEDEDGNQFVKRYSYTLLKGKW